METIKYDILKPWLTLDPWQEQYITTQGNCFLLCGRQCGKTTAMSIKFGRRACDLPNRTILMIAFTEKQAYNLFFKTLMFIQATNPTMICKGSKKPTKHEIHLKNGSRIMCYAAGLEGEGIRTYTVTDLVIDEAAPMAREVFIATMPMLAVTGGTLDISSTPRGKEGFFYECSKRDDFTKFYVSAENCPRHNTSFLQSQKETMTRLEYAQEYQAIFLDEVRQYFPTDIIQSCLTLQRVSQNVPSPSGESESYCGVDIARLGEDDTVIVSMKKVNDILVQTDMEISKQSLITETALRVKNADKTHDYKKIYIDTGGVGGGVFDILLDDEQLRRKIVSIDNQARSIDYNEKFHKKLMKEDLYHNLLRAMESGRIQLFNEKEILLSLKSIQYEYEEGKLKIFGNYTHIAEAIVRAAWCLKSKDLNIWVA